MSIALTGPTSASKTRHCHKENDDVAVLLDVSPDVGYGVVDLAKLKWFRIQCPAEPGATPMSIVLASPTSIFLLQTTC